MSVVFRKFEIGGVNHNDSSLVNWNEDVFELLSKRRVKVQVTKSEKTSTNGETYLNRSIFDDDQKKGKQEPTEVLQREKQVSGSVAVAFQSESYIAGFHKAVKLVEYIVFLNTVLLLSMQVENSPDFTKASQLKK